MRDVQNNADILVDPEGVLERRNHWEKTSHSMLVGAILHVLYAEEDKTLARVTHPIARDERTVISSRHQTPCKVPRDQIACLEVTADHCPQVLLRVLGLIARHGAIPHGILFERDQSSLRIEVEVDALAPAHLRTLNFKIE